MSPSPNTKIEHITTINAPIEEVWEKLIDIQTWKTWNKWTLLNADGAVTGTNGKLMASFDGNDEWKSFDFTFGEVDSQTHTLCWFGSVGPRGCLFHGYHTMKLEEIKCKNDGPSATRLIHTEKFHGILPRFGMGLPYQKLNRNYQLMNEALKTSIETAK